MTEDIQDMEDILSSIKNILEEDEKHQTESSKAADLDVDVLDDVLNSSSDDDILELSPEMVISEQPSEEIHIPVDTQETVISDSVEDIADSEIISFDNNAGDTNIVDMTLSDDNNESSELNNEEEPFVISVEEEDESLNNIFTETNEITEVVNEDPAIDFINEIITEANQEETFVSPVDELVEETPVFETTDTYQEELVATIQAAEVQNNEDDIDVFNIQETIAVEDNEELISSEVDMNVVQPVIKTDTIVEELEIDPQVDSALSSKQDTTDVSANIISNFAKMFSREDNVPSSSADSLPEISSVGSTSKTLEEFVLDSIVKVVGKEISQQWNGGADFKSFAEAEIIRQTKEWINDNLPSVVEKVVKQEIERVIAKVGS